MPITFIIILILIIFIIAGLVTFYLRKDIRKLIACVINKVNKYVNN